MAHEVTKLCEIAKKQPKNPILTDISAVQLVEKPQEIEPATRNVRVRSLRSLNTPFIMIRQKNVLKLIKYDENLLKLAKI